MVISSSDHSSYKEILYPHCSSQVSVHSAPTGRNALSVRLDTEELVVLNIGLTSAFSKLEKKDKSLNAEDFPSASLIDSPVSAALSRASTQSAKLTTLTCWRVRCEHPLIKSVPQWQVRVRWTRVDQLVSNQPSRCDLMSLEAA